MAAASQPRSPPGSARSPTPCSSARATSPTSAPTSAARICRCATQTAPSPGHPPSPGSSKIGMVDPQVFLWRLFLQGQVGHEIVTAPFSLNVQSSRSMPSPRRIPDVDSWWVLFGRVAGTLDRLFFFLGHASPKLSVRRGRARAPRWSPRIQPRRGAGRDGDRPVADGRPACASALAPAGWTAGPSRARPLRAQGLLARSFFTSRRLHHPRSRA